MGKWKLCILAGILGASLAACDGDGGAAAQTGGAGQTPPATGTGSSGPAVAQSVVDACRACHRDELSLAGRNADTLATAIADMAAGRVAHVAPMPELSDAERVALARVLSSGM